MPVSPTLERLRQEGCLGYIVQVYPQLHNETLSPKNNNRKRKKERKSQVCCCKTITSAEAGGSLESRSLRSTWAT